MSYRTYIDDTQIFGNNDSYPEWYDFIKSQNIDVDEEGGYEGNITDFMGMLKTLETISMRLEKERREQVATPIEHKKQLNSQDEMDAFDDYFNTKQQSLLDNSHIYDDILKANETVKDLNPEYQDYTESLFDKLKNLIHNGYMFMPITAYNACKEKLQPCRPFSTPKHFNCYTLKDGMTIHVRAN